MMKKKMIYLMLSCLLLGISGCGTQPEVEEVVATGEGLLQTKSKLESDYIVYMNDDYLQLPLFQKSMKNGKFQTTDTDVRIEVLRYACKTYEATIGSNWVKCEELESEEVRGRELAVDWKTLLDDGESFTYTVHDKTKSMDTCIMRGETTKQAVERLFDQLTFKAQVPWYFCVRNIKEEGICDGNAVAIYYQRGKDQWSIGFSGHDKTGVWVMFDYQKKNENETKTKMYAYFEGMTIQECMKEIQK